MLNNKHTIIITGVSAIIGQGVVKSIKKTYYSNKIIGIDKNYNIYSKYICDLFIQKPKCDEKDKLYLKFWIDLITKYNIDIIIPCIEIDVLFFDKNRDYFKDLNVSIVLNNSKLINLSQNKWKFYKYLKKEFDDINIPTIKPSSWKDTILKLGKPPFIIKPICGNGSRGIQLINDKIDFDYWVQKSSSKIIIQKYIGSDDEEYTASVFGLGEGNIIPPLIFKRKLSVEGNTKLAEVVNNQIIEETICRLSKLLKPIGPTNFQFRVENNIAYLLEINPRFSSSNSLRTIFNYNEAKMCIDFYVFNRKPTIPIIKKGIALRYLEDYSKIC